MKKWLAIFAAWSVISCGGKLSDEQRKEMREQMEAHRIKKLSPSEITDAAFKKGSAISAELADVGISADKIDSLQNVYTVRIQWQGAASRPSNPVIAEIHEAYLAAPVDGLHDNIQEVPGEDGADSIVFTKPVLNSTDAGSSALAGVWNIWMAKRDIVLGMKRR